ncbi:hypothetical protein NQ317_005655 [Molorchus minor]|uniref:Derlin n=1 Tax=Molorchus minor TaxID=1323400 RepID=A0ABQ9K6C9_9CUCU|nr:hypothetical protein NQ317_005655 [Molorchus minor]
MAYQSLRNEYLNMPPVTRAYTTACVITTLAVVKTPFLSTKHLYFNSTRISVTIPALFQPDPDLARPSMATGYDVPLFGTFGFNFFFNMIFTYRYCRMLEEGSFRNRTADFVLMFLFGGACMIIFAFFVNLLFLGQAFTIMLVYVWSRRNPYVRMNFFGLLNFQAPYLPWILLAFSLLLGNAVYVDLMGIAVGHIYYFLEDVFPNQRGGFKILKTPSILRTLCDGLPDDGDYQRLPEEQPEGSSGAIKTTPIII